MERWRVLCLALAMVIPACATAGEDPADDDDDDDVVVADASPGQPDSRPGAPDAAPGTPDAAPGPPDAPPTPVSITLSHSTSDTIVAENSVSCNLGTPDFFHADNSYFRVFDLPALGVTSNFTVTQVQVGVEDATGASGSQPATLRLHTLAGAPALANMTQINSTPTTVPDQLLSIHSIPVSSVVVPAGSKLVVELFTPDGQTVGNRFFVGSNNLGESDATYLVAGDCDVLDLTTTTAIGFPGMHWVVKVTGTHIP